MIVNPPVGQRISISPTFGRSARPDASYFGDDVYWFDTGTSALAAALAQAMGDRERGVEVLLPAYTCPAVIAAVRYIGATPVLVDLIPDRSWMDLDVLSSRINSKTAAVIAVNFLGIDERVQDIRRILDGTGARLIYDCCQAAPFEQEHLEYADAVTYSFGRGKPASVLHGGAAVFKVRPECLQRHLLTKPGESRLKVIFKLAAYNFALNKYVYSMLKLIPALKIGVTDYRPLRSLGFFREHEYHLLPTVIKAYTERTDTEYRLIRSHIASIRSRIGLMDLSAASGCDSARLLRFPVLSEGFDHREELFREFQAKGLGASRFYEACLPDIRGIDGIGRADDFPNAKNFADRLLTLRVPRKGI